MVKIVVVFFDKLVFIVLDFVFFYLCCIGDFFKSLVSMKVCKLIVVIMNMDFFYLYILMRFLLINGNIMFFSEELENIIFVMRFFFCLN